jgi:DNA-binding IclR family transcriptional regulator
MAERSAKPARRRAGIQSIEVGTRLLRALADSPAALPLKELAERAGMSMSKAHRYLVSLARVELVVQHGATGRYDLGALALGLGLAAMGRIDAMQLGLEALPDLRDRTGVTAVLAIWGDRGPTVIRIEEPTRPVSMNVRVGTVLPVASTAIGQMFAAYLPRSVTDPLAASDAAKGAKRRRRPPRLSDRALAEVRARGLGRSIAVYFPGVNALAAPILDFQGRIVAVMGVVGHAAHFDAGWDGRVAQSLQAAAAGVSRRLGHRG